MGGKKKQKKKQATSRRTAKQTAQKPKNKKQSSKQEPKQTSRASSKPNTPKTSSNQTSKASSKQDTKQEAKQEKQSDKDKNAEQVEETKQASADIEVVIKKHDDSNNGHPHVILEDFEGDKHVSVGLTTRKLKGKNATNYKLEKDPLGEVEESYMRRQGSVDYQKNYFEPRKGKLTKKDYERALLYGQRAKEKYIKKQQEKKKT